MRTPTTTSSLAVPVDAIRMTSTFLRSVKHLESCCFWFGRRQHAGGATVEAIVVPRQRNERTHYHIEADAMLSKNNPFI